MSTVHLCLERMSTAKAEIRRIMSALRDISKEIADIKRAGNNTDPRLDTLEGQKNNLVAEQKEQEQEHDLWKNLLQIAFNIAKAIIEFAGLRVT